MTTMVMMMVETTALATTAQPAARAGARTEVNDGNDGGNDDTGNDDTDNDDAPGRKSWRKDGGEG